MENEKPWWQSTTIWASVLQVVVSIGVALGLFDQATGAEIVSQFPELLVGAVGAILGVIAFWGRYTATKTLK